MRVGARGASASERAELAAVSGLSSRSASCGAEPSGPAGGRQVLRVAARQPSAPGGAGRPPLRWGLTASSSLSHAGVQRVLSCRAAWRVLRLRSVRATYLESEERIHGAKKHQSQGATSSWPFSRRCTKYRTVSERRNISEVNKHFRSEVSRLKFPDMPCMKRAYRDK